LSGTIRCSICGKEYSSKFVVDVFGTFICIFCFGSNKRRIDRGTSTPPLTNDFSQMFSFPLSPLNIDPLECRELLCDDINAKLGVCEHSEASSPDSIDRVEELLPDKIVVVLQEGLRRVVSELREEIRRKIREAFEV